MGKHKKAARAIHKLVEAVRHVVSAWEDSGADPHLQVALAKAQDAAELTSSTLNKKLKGRKHVQ